MQAKTTLRGRATPLDPLPDQPVGLCGCGCKRPTTARWLTGHQKARCGPLAGEVPGRLDTPCWVWLGASNGAGYAETGNRREGTRALAHRAVYEEMVGPIPEGLTLDHLCANTLCVNPVHLEPVTFAENTRRQWADGRADPARQKKAQTHCKRGHEFTGANTLVSGGRRHCRACAREKARRRRANKH